MSTAQWPSRLVGAGMLLEALGAFAGPTSAHAGELIGQVLRMRTVYQDTMLDIARDFDLGFVELMAANPGVNPWIPGEGTAILLPGAHLVPDGPRQGILINIPEMRLYYFPPGGEVMSFPIGVGREGWGTPRGSTTVMRKATNPVWVPPPSIRHDDPTLPASIGPGPDNPLGDRAFYLGWKSYLIHGTNIPWGVGRRSSHGCLRLYPDDMTRLYDLVQPGTRVTVVDQPTKYAWIGGELFMQAHPTLAQADEIEIKSRATPVPLSDHQLLLRAAGDQAHRIDWPTVWQAATKRNGIPTQITRPLEVSAAPTSNRIVLRPPPSR